ncbi:MAG: hypothetical protein AB7O45_10220 [Alphaproteobacteria bacterium]
MTDKTGTQLAVADRGPKPLAKPPLRGGGGLTMIVPQDVEQAWRMADLIHQSRLAPESLESPQKILVAIMHGLEVGLPPMQAVQSIAVVGNRPTIWGDAALGLCWSSGLLIDHDEGIRGEGEAMVGWCAVTRAGRARAVERTFSVADARKAGLWNHPKKAPWREYPQRMLMLRARSWALRDAFADVLKGLRLREEVQDYVDTTAEPIETGPRVTGAALIEQAKAGESGGGPVDAEDAANGGADGAAADTIAAVADTQPAAGDAPAAAADSAPADTVAGADTPAGGQDPAQADYDPKPYAIAIKRRTDKTLNYLDWRQQWADRLADVRTLVDIDRLVEVNRDGLDHCRDTDEAAKSGHRRAIDRLIEEARARLANEPPPAA